MPNIFTLTGKKLKPCLFWGKYMSLMKPIEKKSFNKNEKFPKLWIGKFLEAL